MHRHAHFTGNGHGGRRVDARIVLAVAEHDDSGERLGAFGFEPLPQGLTETRFDAARASASFQSNGALEP